MMLQSSLIDPSTNQPFEIERSNPVRNGMELNAYHYDVLNRWNDSDHFQFVTSESAAAFQTPYVRRRISDAAHVEFDNNSYCRGVVMKIVSEVVGTGPNLEVQPDTKTDRSKRAAKLFEQRWQEHNDEMDFVGKLTTAVTEWILGGELFCLFRSNYGLKTVQVDWENYEGAQFSNPAHDFSRIGINEHEYPHVDGIDFDRVGNVRRYWKLRNHPGGRYTTGYMDGEVDPISPDVCVHMFRKERPSQYRGISHLAPCLELFGKLRRYTEAVIETAEQAASILGTIETGFSPDKCAPGTGPAKIPIGGGMFLTMPDGWSANPFKAEQPVTGYAEFKNEILHEIFSCLLAPWNIASGSSEEYNFSSARLDGLIFAKVIRIIRKMLERKLLNRFFDFWTEFATFTPGIMPSGLGAFTYKWFWDNSEPIDQEKEAKANKTKKESGLLDETKYWQEQGINVHDAIDQEIRLDLYRMKRTEELAQEMGVTLPQETDQEKTSNGKSDKRNLSTSIEVSQPQSEFTFTETVA